MTPGGDDDKIDSWQGLLIDPYKAVLAQVCRLSWTETESSSY